MSSFKTTQEILGSPFSLPASCTSELRQRLDDGRHRRYFVNTVIVVGSALVLVMILGAMCAYVLARFEFRGNRLIYYSDAGRADLPGLPGDRAAVLRAEEPRAAQHPAGADHHLRRVRAAVHRLLPARLLQDAAGRGLRGGADRRRR